MNKVVNIIFRNTLRIFLIGLLLIPFNLLAPHSYAFQPTTGSWSLVGLSNNSIRALAVDPTNPDILYAASCDGDGVGIYKSTDGGTSWNSSNNGLPNPACVTGLAVNPSNHNIVYAGVYGHGVYKSTDGGANWANTASISNPAILGIFMDQNNPDTIYVDGGSGCVGLRKTTNGGTSWTNTVPTCDLYWVAIDPTNSNTLYTIGGNVFKSTDAAANWSGTPDSTIAQYNGQSVSRGIVIDPNNTNVLYVGTEQGGMFKSTDGFQSWTQLSPPGPVSTGLIVDPIRPNTVYTIDEGSGGSQFSAHVSTDGGANWSDINTNAPDTTVGGANPLVIPTNNPNVLYALTSNGIYAYGLQPTQVLGINSGGGTQGNFVADTDVSGGSTYTSSNSVNTSNVTNPAPEAVYKSVRYGNFTYTIPNLTPNTNYLVKLHFNELYWGTSNSSNQGGVGTRVFNVSINGTQVLNNFDIFLTAGGADKALVKQFTKPADSNGNITIAFSTVVDNAMVNGIEIDTSGPTPPTLSSLSLNSGGIGSGSFLSDDDYAGGTTYSSTASVDTSGVTNPAPQSVYQTVRYGNMTYNIPNLIPNASYTVKLHFNELYWGTSLANGLGGNGSRVFDVSINGSNVLNNFDIYQTAGGANKAVVESFTANADSNGKITIDFANVTDNAMINGIELSH